MAYVAVHHYSFQLDYSMQKVTLEVNAPCETAKRIKVEMFLSRDNASRDILNLKDDRRVTFLAFYATSRGSIKVGPIDFTLPLATTARLQLDKDLSLSESRRLPPYRLSLAGLYGFRRFSHYLPRSELIVSLEAQDNYRQCVLDKISPPPGTPLDYFARRILGHRRKKRAIGLISIF